MKRIFLSILALFILFNVALGGLAYYGWHLFETPGPLAKETVLVLEKGSGLRKIAKQLHVAGIIHHELAFILGVRVKEQTRLLKAGEFEFSPHMSGQAVMELLVSGKTVAHFLTIPEGLQSREIAELIKASDVLVGDLTEQLPEGSILPETYHYSRGEKRNAIAGRMKAAMSQATLEIWGQFKDHSLVKSKQELVILASIIEKETGQADERPHVAGVFLNRLRKKMRLQSDPTVTYGITLGKKDLGRPISKKDLAAKNDYNTYTLSALPKGPICSPGLDSLRAVLTPLKTKDLYFVADGRGGHAFARTLAEHNRNVRKWRKLKKAKTAK